MFSSKIIGYLTIACLAVAVAGDVVEYVCCDTDSSCLAVFEGPAFPTSCKYFYADPFPDTVQGIRDLCPNNDGGVYPVACIDESKLDVGGTDVDAVCCDGYEECPPLDDETPAGCGFYYGKVPLADFEDACSVMLPFEDGPTPPDGSLTCLVIIAAFGGQDPHFKACILCYLLLLCIYLHSSLTVIWIFRYSDLGGRLVRTQID